MIHDLMIHADNNSMYIKFYSNHLVIGHVTVFGSEKITPYSKLTSISRGTNEKQTTFTFSTINSNQCVTICFNNCDFFYMYKNEKFICTPETQDANIHVINYHVNQVRHHILDLSPNCDCSKF